jgi:hypothetical protein
LGVDLEGSIANGFVEEVVVVVDESMVSLDGDAFDSEEEEDEGDDDDDDGEEEELKEAKGYEKRPRLFKGRIETEMESGGVEIEAKRAIAERVCERKIDILEWLTGWEAMHVFSFFSFTAN